MRIIRARTAGFCMGVGRALHILDSALAEKNGVRIVTYGPVIHNPQVLADYEARGVVCTEDAEEIRPGDVVVIRAHGLPCGEEARLAGKGVCLRDATCPKVKKAQLAIARATASGGRTLLLYGEARHPEVRGLVSYAGGQVRIFSGLAELQTLNFDRERQYVLAAQTTQDRGEFARICVWLRARCPETPCLDTICDATVRRQQEVLDIAHKVDGVIVVGGRQSGNTRRLAALASECGVQTWHVETPEELKKEWLRHKTALGLTAGASTPKHLIDRTQRFLEHPDGEALPEIAKEET
jgi:4-hydroxy-3-methylbut-2-enyl diphosphate reductase